MSQASNIVKALRVLADEIRARGPAAKVDFFPASPGAEPPPDDPVRGGLSFSGAGGFQVNISVIDCHFTSPAGGADLPSDATAELEFDAEIATPFYLEITRETDDTAWGKAAGLKSEIQVGEGWFDDSYFVTTMDARRARKLLKPETTAKYQPVAERHLFGFIRNRLIFLYEILRK